MRSELPKDSPTINLKEEPLIKAKLMLLRVEVKCHIQEKASLQAPELLEYYETLLRIIDAVLVEKSVSTWELHRRLSVNGQNFGNACKVVDLYCQGRGDEIDWKTSSPPLTKEQQMEIVRGEVASIDMPNEEEGQ
jgi:hypothetical protein